MAFEDLWTSKQSSLDRSQLLGRLRRRKTLNRRLQLSTALGTLSGKAVDSHVGALLQIEARLEPQGHPRQVMGHDKSSFSSVRDLLLREMDRLRLTTEHQIEVVSTVSRWTPID